MDPKFYSPPTTEQVQAAFRLFSGFLDTVHANIRSIPGVHVEKSRGINAVDNELTVKNSDGKTLVTLGAVQTVHGMSLLQDYEAMPLFSVPFTAEELPQSSCDEVLAKVRAIANRPSKNPGVARDECGLA